MTNQELITKTIELIAQMLNTYKFKDDPKLKECLYHFLYLRQTHDDTETNKETEEDQIQQKEL